MREAGLGGQSTSKGGGLREKQSEVVEILCDSDRGEARLRDATSIIVINHTQPRATRDLSTDAMLTLACSLALGSFTAFVGVALNDQLTPGCGQLCVVKGVHEETERFFKMQREKGGIVGIEGPGWPRFKRGGGTDGNGVFLNCT